MFISLSPLLALLAFSAQSAELPTQQSRSSLYSFTIYNGCDKHFAPVFEPALPGVKEWPVIPAGGSKTVHFRSDTYRGSFYAPIHGSKKNGTLHTTRAEMDVESGNYDISVAHGFNVGMYLQVLGQQQQGHCTAAVCSDRHCKDAYHESSGLMHGSRAGESTKEPNHSCPPDFVQWSAEFCYKSS